MGDNENIGPVHRTLEDAVEVAPQSAEVMEAEAKRHAFSVNASNALKMIAEKDPSAHFNWDRIGSGEQAIAFTKNGRIIVHNTPDRIVIEQEGKADLEFSAAEEESALKAIEGIVEGFE